MREGKPGPRPLPALSLSKVDVGSGVTDFPPADGRFHASEALLSPVGAGEPPVRDWEAVQVS